MKKKVNQVTELKNRIKAMEIIAQDNFERHQSEVKELRACNDRATKLIGDVSMVLGVPSFAGAVSDADVLRIARDFVRYRKDHEGAIDIGSQKDKETIAMLREIIRWQIAPATADQSKLIEDIKRMTGYGS